MKELVLLLTQDTLAAYIWGEAVATIVASFAADDDSALRQLLQQLHQPQTRYYVLVDRADENIQHEYSPHLSASDRSALQARKLAQLFRSTPYRRAAVLTCGSRGGQDLWQLSALNCSAVLAPILAELAAARVILQGVYSVPLLQQAMLHTLQLNVPHLLLVSHCQAGDLRQSYFSPAGLLFTRLAHFNLAHTPAAQAAEIGREINRAQQYLRSAGLLTRSDPLRVLGIGHAELMPHRETIAQAVDGEVTELMWRADASELAQQLKLKRRCTTMLDVLFAQLLEHKPRNHYAPVEALKFQRLQILSRGLVLGSLFILVCSGILAVVNISAAQRAQQVVADPALQSVQQRLRHYSALLANASEPARLQSSVRLYQQQIAQAPQPVPTLKQISQIWQDFPMLTLDDVQWQTGAASEHADASAVEKAAITQTVLLSGRVQNPNAYRAALVQINDLLRRLQSWPGARVMVKQWPLDLRSEATIKAQSERQLEADQPRRVDFIVQLDLIASSVASTQAQP